MAYNNSEQHASGGGGDDNMQDPSAGGLFNVNYKKHEDLKNMLDQNKDALKLEAMKRIIGMIAKGKNASMLFPAVVKNVACKNIEVKKLVYVYLERYAEEQQDLALLSISTFQRGLKDSNQMIRASALRVLSSIRVPIIVPIMLLAIKEGVNDMCAFVRKTAAHAIPKLYSLDPEQKENLIEIIDKMLSDRTTLVAGSVVMAYQEVCPDRIDLVHRHFRNLCSLLVDVDEWGQIAIISMLTRYARTQFTDPNRYDAEDDSSEKPFYDDDEEEDEKPAKEKAPKYVMDADHRLLLKSTKSLVQSRNAAVVMSVAQLYYHLAPRAEMSVVVKALIRLLRGRREVQAIVLQNIASITLKRKGIFGPYLKSFYVRSSDPTHVRVLKLEVLTNLASESNIAVILREFQTYVRSSDKQFVAHTIQAIARCATDIQEVTDTCLAGLVSLLSNRDESVVAESVVVIKKLLQMNPSQHSDIIKRTARLLDQIQVPMARASILWLIGEYSEFVPRIAPDVLRKEAKHFTAQEDIVKLQVVNLAAKLYLTNHKQTKLLTQYVLQLAKYDQNYDIRDRARFIRHLIMPSADPDAAGISFHKYAKKILLAAKPAPVLESPFTGRDAYQLGSLSHVLNGEAQGYQRLPDFPETQPDPTVRNVEIPKIYEEERAPTRSSRKSKTPLRKPKSFYSDEEESSEEEEDTESDDDDESESKSESSEESSSSETEGPDSRISDSDNVVVGRKSKCAPKKAAVESTEESEDSEEDSESGTDDTSSDASDSSSSEEEEEKKAVAPPPKRNAKAKSKPAEVNLLDLDDFLGGAPPAAAAPGPFLTPTVTADLRGLSLGVDGGGSDFTISTASPQTTHQLLHRVTGEGLAATYRFTRQPYKADEKMISVEIEFTNHGHNPICNLTMGNKKLQHGLRVGDFDEIESVQPGAAVTALLGVDFCDTTQPLVFDLVTKTRKFNVSIKIPVGELVRPFATPQTDFLKQKASLAGMNETKCRLQADSGWSMHSIAQKVIRDVNVCRVPSTQEQVHRFAGKTAHGGSALLITIDLSASRGGSGADSSSAELSVNCEKMVIGSMIFTQLKENLVV